MRGVAVLLVIAATGWLAIAGTVAEAKGPPAKVTISGGGLKSEVVIERSDLVAIDAPEYFEDTGGSPYVRASQIPGEVPYVVDIFSIEDSSNIPQLFLSGNYFPANANHPSLLEDSGTLWKAGPTFAALLDGRIKSALSAADLPNSGGPPTGGNANGWAYALLAAGVLLLLGSVATVAYFRRN